jgi:hypothetical protein
MNTHNEAIQYSSLLPINDRRFRYVSQEVSSPLLDWVQLSEDLEPYIKKSVLFESHACIQAEAKDYIRFNQEQTVLKEYCFISCFSVVASASYATFILRGLFLLTEECVALRQDFGSSFTEHEDINNS